MNNEIINIKKLKHLVCEVAVYHNEYVANPAEEKLEILIKKLFDLSVVSDNAYFKITSRKQHDLNQPEK